MGGKTNSRGIRLLATIKTLAELTDSSHGISAGALRKEIANKCALLTGSQSSAPDKRTLYDDIETIKTAGFEVFRGPGTRGRYYFTSNFEAWELRFLVDAVRTSKSITETQGQRIVGKLKSIASIHSRKLLDHRFLVQQTFHNGSFKQTAYALDQIELALMNGWKVSYKPIMTKNEGGALKAFDQEQTSQARIVDPIEYVYSSEGFYYLIILDKSSKSGTKTPRIDRMREVKALPGTKSKHVSKREKIAILDMYKHSFGMFESDHLTEVTFRLPQKHAKSLSDKFGETVSFEAIDALRCRAKAKVNLSDVFYGWISQFAGLIVIEEPSEAVNGMKSFLDKNREAYLE